MKSKHKNINFKTILVKTVEHFILSTLHQQIWLNNKALKALFKRQTSQFEFMTILWHCMTFNFRIMVKTQGINSAKC